MEASKASVSVQRYTMIQEESAYYAIISVRLV